MSGPLPSSQAQLGKLAQGEALIQVLCAFVPAPIEWPEIGFGKSITLDRSTNTPPFF
jgi:hypothetical protein